MYSITEIYIHPACIMYVPLLDDISFGQYFEAPAMCPVFLVLLTIVLKILLKAFYVLCQGMPKKILWPWTFVVLIVEFQGDVANII